MNRGVVSVDPAEINARLPATSLEGVLLVSPDGLELSVRKWPRLRTIAFAFVGMSIIGGVLTALPTWIASSPKAKLSPEDARTWTILFGAFMSAVIVVSISLVCAGHWRASRRGPVLTWNRSTGVLNISQLERTVHTARVLSIVSLSGSVCLWGANSQHITALGIEVDGDPNPDGIVWVCWGFPIFSQIRRLADSIAAELGVPHRTVTPRKAP
jgi:hypothetical protein